MDLHQALREGPGFVRNAEDSLNRNITNPDLLYMWDNQVVVADTFLADTEPYAAEDAELATLRSTLRDLKKQIERKVVEFEATQEGEEPPEDPPAEEQLADLKEVGGEIAAMADDAIKQDIKDTKGLPTLEDAIGIVNGFLADSEPFSGDKQLAKMREAVRKRKAQIDDRIRTIQAEWRAADIAAGG